MDRFVKLRHEAHVRANDVCTKNSDAVDVNPGAKKTRLALDGHVTESTRLIAVRDSAIEARKGATEQCRLCRAALRAAARPIVTISKRVSLPDTVVSTFTIPGSMSDEELQAHMQGLHDRVLPYKDAFEAEGLPTDTLTKLTDGIKALQDARAARAATIQDAASSEAALSENQDQASSAILALESVMPTTTQANRELVKKLRVARRVGPRTTQPAAAASSGTPTPSPTTPSTPTPATEPSSTITPSTPTATVPPSTTAEPAKDKAS